MKNIIFLKKKCPPESLRANTNCPAAPEGLSLQSSIKWILLALGIESCRASSRNSENLSVLFSKHNVWHQALPSTCLCLAAPPARGKAFGSTVRDLLRKKAKILDVPWSKSIMAKQKKIHAKLHCFHQDSHLLSRPPCGKRSFVIWSLPTSPHPNTAPSAQNSSPFPGLAGLPHCHVKES